MRATSDLRAPRTIMPTHWRSHVGAYVRIRPLRRVRPVSGPANLAAGRSHRSQAATGAGARGFAYSISEIHKERQSNEDISQDLPQERNDRAAHGTAERRGKETIEADVSKTPSKLLR